MCKILRLEDIYNHDFNRFIAQKNYQMTLLSTLVEGEGWSFAFMQSRMCEQGVCKGGVPVYGKNVRYGKKWHLQRQKL